MPPDDETSRRLGALEVGLAGLVAREESCRDRIIEDRAEMRALREVVVGLAGDLKQATGDFTELRKMLEAEREDRKRTAEMARERQAREEQAERDWWARWRAAVTPQNLLALATAATVIASAASMAWQGQASPEDVARALLEAQKAAQRIELADDGGAALPDDESAELLHAAGYTEPAP